MHRLSDFLHPESVNLALSAIDQEAALQEIVTPLRHDPRISNWQEFSQIIFGSSAFPLEIRPLSKLAAGDEGQGASARRPAVYKEVLEDAITASAGMAYEATPPFASAVEFRKRPIEEKHSIMIHHLRTNAVQDLILTAGCSPHGIHYGKGKDLVFLIFVIAIPHALNNEYLRVMGVIARLCQESIFLNKLLTSSTPEEFIKLLSQGQL